MRLFSSARTVILNISARGEILSSPKLTLSMRTSSRTRNPGGKVGTKFLSRGQFRIDFIDEKKVFSFWVYFGIREFTLWDNGKNHCVNNYLQPKNCIPQYDFIFQDKQLYFTVYDKRFSRTILLRALNRIKFEVFVSWRCHFTEKYTTLVKYC